MSSHTVAVTDDSFAAEVDQAKGLVLVDFWATWCGPCVAIAPYLDKIAEANAGKLKVAKLDVDQNQKTAMRFNVRSIPTMMFFKDMKDGKAPPKDPTYTGLDVCTPQNAATCVGAGT